MSRIITSEKCDHCGKEYNNIYISFGHPDEDFTWKWKCEECKKVNERIIEKMPNVWMRDNLSIKQVF